MALSIDYSTNVVTVPQADLTLVSGSTYTIDGDDLRQALRDIEDNEDHMGETRIIDHVAPFTVSGQTLPRLITVLSPYTLTFEDTGSPYAVTVENANINLDRVNINNVSVRAQGLIVAESSGGGGGASADDIWNASTGDHQVAGSMGEAVQETALAADRAGTQRLS